MNNTEDFYSSEQILSNYQRNRSNRIKKNLLILVKILIELFFLSASIYLFYNYFNVTCNSNLEYSLILIILESCITIFIVIDKYIFRKFYRLRISLNVF